jgi:hypothetical protein
MKTLTRAEMIRTANALMAVAVEGMDWEDAEYEYGAPEGELRPMGERPLWEDSVMKEHGGGSDDPSVIAAEASMLMSEAHRP